MTERLRGQMIQIAKDSQAETGELLNTLDNALLWGDAVKVMKRVVNRQKVLFDCVRHLAESMAEVGEEGKEGTYEHLGYKFSPRPGGTTVNQGEGKGEEGVCGV
jgi:phage portal protein BeeE